jgi:hypothetical protein
MFICGLILFLICGLALTCFYEATIPDKQDWEIYGRKRKRKVTDQGMVNGIPLSTAKIPSKTGKLTDIAYKRLLIIFIMD